MAVTYMAVRQHLPMHVYLKVWYFYCIYNGTDLDELIALTL